MVVLARWESDDPELWVELCKSEDRYFYTSRGICGVLREDALDAAAVAIMQEKVNSGHYPPGARAVTMKRIGPIEEPVRVISGPTYLDGLDLWEVVVNLAVYSDKLAHAAYVKLPEFADFGGRIYRKSGFRGSDCTAWYRSKGK